MEQLDHVNDCSAQEAFNYLQNQIELWINNDFHRNGKNIEFIAQSIAESSNHPDNLPAYLILADKLKDWIEKLIDDVHDPTKSAESIAEVLMLGGWKFCNLYLIARNYLKGADELFDYALVQDGDKIIDVNIEHYPLFGQMQESKLKGLKIIKFDLSTVNIGEVFTKPAQLERRKTDGG